MSKRKRQKKQEEPFFPARIYVSRDKDGTDIYYYNAHTDLNGLDHGTKVTIYERVADRTGTVDVSTTLKERD